MRVVVNDSSSQSGRLAQLLRVAQLHEKFNDVPTALNIYAQIQKDYQNVPEQKSVIEQAKQNASLG